MPKQQSLVWVGFITFITVALILTRFMPSTLAVLIGAVIGAGAGRYATHRTGR